MKKPKKDHVVAVVKAGLSGLPMFGGPLASLVGDYIPTATQKILEDATEDLRTKLEELEGRIDADLVDKDEFAELFKSSYLLIHRSHHEEKVNAAVNLIVNLLLKEGDPEKLSYTELDHFARCLDLLSIGALQVLQVILEINLQAHGKGEALRKSSQLTVRGLESRLPGLDSSLLMGLLRELGALNLLSLPPSRGGIGGDQEVHLTPLGFRFIRHILDLA